MESKNIPSQNHLAVQEENIGNPSQNLIGSVSYGSTHLSDHKKKKTRWQRFEDYWYFDSHFLFEMHAYQMGGVVKNLQIILISRILLFLLSTFHYLVLAIHNNRYKLVNIQFLTVWGATFTWFLQIMGIAIHFCPTVQKAYQPFALWKWYTYLFNLTFLTEIVITIVFWTLLWPIAKDDPQFAPVWDRAQIMMDHSVPLIILVIDYALLNSIPFVMRHLVAQIGILTVYMMINLTFSLSNGKPVYPPLDWTKWTGWLMCVLTWLVFVVLSYLMQKLTLWKLKAQGHHEIVVAINPQKTLEE